MATAWRPTALILLILAIIVGPFLLTREAMRERDRAAKQVEHTLQVEAKAMEVMSNVRDVESAALALSHGATAPLLRTRLRDSRPAVERNLAQLAELSRDNPRQQERIGYLRAIVMQRLTEIDRLMARGDAPARAIVENMVNRYPIARLANEIIAEERHLLADRRAREVAMSRRAERTGWVGLGLQLGLLALAAFLLLRTARSRTAAQLDARRASDRAAAILDTVREPIVLLDNGLRVVMHNAAFGELYGVAGDHRGELLSSVGDGAWQGEEALRRLADVAGRGRELWDFEQRQRTADGLERMMLINAVRMSLPDSDDQVVLVTASDVSAQKASEREIRELNRQLEGKVEQVSDVNRELEAFSYSVSHDLRAPLRHIAAFGDKLEAHLGDRADDKARHYLSVITGSARRMSQLIDDLLVYSRLGRSAMRLQAVDFQSIVAEKRALLDANASQEYPDHRIEWRIAPLPIVSGDENMLRQVWLNLLGNAVKYSSKTEPARIEVGYTRLADGTHQFEVSDNGVGFDMAYSGKLFGVFQRLHSANDFQGTGIGLASVRRVLARHGGRIWAESSPGQGARFWFTLPPSGESAPLPESTA